MITIFKSNDLNQSTLTTIAASIP